MRLAVAVVNAIALLLLGSAAIAAGKPRLVGVYAYTINSPCQAKIGTIKDGDGDVVSLNGYFGEIYHEIGTATFSAGTLSLTGTRVRGALAIVDGVGRKMSAPTATSMSVPFSNTASTITVGGKTWPAVYASIDGNNVAHFMSFLNRDGTDCATTGTFVRRQ
jgi:hypothetical protein